MTIDHNSEYYVLRAEQEEEAARTTASALAATIHHNLADRYRAKAREGGEGLKLRLVRD